ncbi:MAG TPA: hypothetical protein VGZ47_03915 [Gemmataceae bacterium]|nr:hypothetical protein [Gemmataceae bacterium]
MPIMVPKKDAGVRGTNCLHPESRITASANDHDHLPGRLQGT